MFRPRGPKGGRYAAPHRRRFVQRHEALYMQRFAQAAPPRPCPPALEFIFSARTDLRRTAEHAYLILSALHHSQESLQGGGGGGFSVSVQSPAAAVPDMRVFPPVPLLGSGGNAPSRADTTYPAGLAGGVRPPSAEWEIARLVC
jgi:hypothetical protein